MKRREELSHENRTAGAGLLVIYFYKQAKKAAIFKRKIQIPFTEKKV